MHAVVDAMPASDRHALVMKSTVPVGTGESIERVFADQGKGFRYVSCPEFLKEGSAVKDFLEPDRVVIGDRGDWAGDAVEALYAPLDAPIVRTDVKSAEMVKLASNAFLATKISFINEIANVCEETGADVVEVARGMGLDDRIGPKFLQAGIGFGGSCFPKDVTALKQLAGNSGYHFQLLNAVIEVNELQKRRVISKLQKHLGSLVGKEIALLGLAFKPNTDDMREASSLVLSSRLQGAGARVRAYDPVAEDEARKLLRGVEFACRRGGGRGRRRRRARDGVARVPRARPRGDGGEHARHAAGRRAQLHRPECRAGRGPGLRGDRPPSAASRRVADAGADPRRRRGDAPAAADLDRVPSRSSRSSTGRSSPSCSTGCAGHGVDDVIMSCGFLASGVRNVLGDGSGYGLRLRYVEEPQPLGTGGALKFAEPLLDERFLMLNGDVLTDLDVSAQLALHEARGARATLALTPVEDPSAYGLVRTLADGEVTGFVEKPSPDQIDTRNISAGIYVLERSVLELLSPAAGLDRARRLPAARRRGAVRLRRRGLLARHRDARALPRGHVRHPRGHGPHGRGARGSATARLRGAGRRERGPGDPVGAGRRGCRIAHGARSAAASCSAAASRSARTRRSTARSSSTARASAPTARCAPASSAAASRSATTRASTTSPCSARTSRSAPATSSPTAPALPGRHDPRRRHLF